MKVAAPGKLFVTGAYAVREGAPGIVLAVDRYAVASNSTSGCEDETFPEVAAAARMLHVNAPTVDVSALYARDDHGGRGDRGQKLGLGSSAAGTVAAVGHVFAARGDRLPEPDCRRRILDLAVAAHAFVQPLGSGADIAAAVYGGALRIARTSRGLDVLPLPPLAVRWCAFALGHPLRTSLALERLDDRRTRENTRAAMDTIAQAAEVTAAAWHRADVAAVVDGACKHVRGLEALGAALELPLVPNEVEIARGALGRRRSLDDFVLLPSGAGGGDVVLWLSARDPSEGEMTLLTQLGFVPLSLRVDARGVHVLE